MSNTDQIYRVMAFIDYWDLQASLNESAGDWFTVDWERFPKWLATHAVRFAHDLPTAELQLEEANIYVALDPTHPGDAELKEWAVTVLDRQPGVRVVLGGRVTGPTSCNACPLGGTPECRRCRGSIAGSGGQTTTDVISVDIFRAAREKAFEVAVIVSSDTGLIPVARHLKTKGLLVVVCGFLPRGAEMSRECSAFLDIGPLRAEFGEATSRMSGHRP